jgi:hypothetical protein
MTLFNRRGATVLALAVMTVLLIGVPSGTVGQSGQSNSVQFDVTVGNDGTIRSYGAELTLSNDAFSQTQTRVQQSEYESYCDALRDEWNQSAVGSYSCSTDQGSETTTVSFTLSDYRPAGDDGVTTRVTDEDRVVFSDQLRNVGSGFSTPAVTYTVEMPGGVVSTSGDVADNNRTVTWETDAGDQLPTVSAQSVQGGGLGLGGLVNLRLVALIGSFLLSGLYVAAIRSEDLDFFDISREPGSPEDTDEP